MKSVISVVLGSYNRRRFLKKALESVRNNRITVPYEIIVVDGGSTDGSLRYLEKQKDVITIIQHNNGTWRGDTIERRSWGYFMNLGFKAAEGKYVCMVSDDSLIVPGSIQNCYDEFEKLLAKGRKVGAIAFYWREWPGSDEYWVGLTLGGRMFVNHGMYLREALEEVGWIEEDRYQFYFADGDMCLKMWRAGYEIADCTQAFVEHYRNANLAARKSNWANQEVDWKIYLKTWCGIFYDPKTGEKGTGSLRLSFADPDDTCRQFQWLHLMNVDRYLNYCQIWANKMKRAILKRVRRKRSSLIG